MSKNFINFHVLISHSPSCLNRDDMNMQNVEGSHRLVLSYSKRINDMSISLVLEKSLSLNSDDWSPVTSGPQLLSSDATSEVWQHSLSVDSHGSKCFFRLRAVE